MPGFVYHDYRHRKNGIALYVRTGIIQGIIVPMLLLSCATCYLWCCRVRTLTSCWCCRVQRLIYDVVVYVHAYHVVVVVCYMLSMLLSHPTMLSCTYSGIMLLSSCATTYLVQDTFYHI